MVAPSAPIKLVSPVLGLLCSNCYKLSRTTPAAVVGILMLTEAVFGPLWAWLFINEIPPAIVIFGGGIIIFAILFEFFLSPKKH